MRIKVLICGLLAAALLLVAAGLPFAPWAMAGAAVIVQVLFAVSWPRLTGAQTPWLITSVILLSALGATAAGLASGPPVTNRHSVEVIACGLLLVFITQVFRGASAKHRLATVVSGVAGVTIAVQGVGWVALGDHRAVLSVTILSLLGLVAAGALSITRLPDRVVLPVSPVLAGALGAAATALPLGLDWVHGLIFGALGGLVVAVVRALSLTSKAVRSLSGVLAVASCMLLLTGSLNWYALQLLGGS
ncbi:hypothetical protein [Glutamicibacter endophyticus]|uniref:hypothetical protein n=1 Tax=Glutamicibacter endophyticus TaxID=1522174 RepID=UPI003AEFAE84